MIKVGVIGIGTMGTTHLDIYNKHSDVQVVAISDIIPARLNGTEKAQGNIKGQAQGGFDFNAPGLAKHDEGMKLIADKNVELVDICLPTPLHVEYAIKALKKGKHLLVEKPVGRTARDAKKLVAAASKAKGMSMCAMCMRFWPGWTWLKDAVTNQTYGKVLSATFRRVTSHPGGPFYSDGDKCGGALLDLHVHDTDFIQYAFGIPQAVTSTGYSTTTNQPDHVVTRYHYDNIPLVMAEGGWSMTPGFGFRMQYCVNFERATAQFDLGLPQPMMLYEKGKPEQAIPLADSLGYANEIAYYLDCIARGQRPATVTLASALDSVRIVEAEAKSIATGKTVKIK